MKKLKTTISKIRYQADNPGGRALDALFHKIKGKRPAEDAIQKQVIHTLALNQDWTLTKTIVNGKSLRR